MRIFFNNFFLILLALLIPASISCTPLQSEVLAPETNSYEPEYSLISLSSIERKTREASVKVSAENGGHGSGTYLLYEGYHVVFTAAHVAANGYLFTVEDMYGNKRVGTVAYLDKKADFAIILIPSFKKIKPIIFKVPSYNPTQEIGKELIFSGYPGRQTLRTVRALISGVEGKRFVMQSTAWSGSSGSCVFDSKGNFVGILFAVSMEPFSGKPVLLESMVWVEPYTTINWTLAKKYIMALN